MSKQVTIAIIGAGSRGYGYAKFAETFPERLKVVAVAEPDKYRRERIAREYNIPQDKCFESWEDFVKLPRMCDAVAICTQDNMHEAPAVACADLKYDILLEKPMAPTAESCCRIVEAVKRNKVMFAVCHVLRYTKYTLKLKEVLASGAIGDIVSIQHLEPVGYWHQAHSFVRGNWRNEEESSFMLLAKCCHDIDWLRGVMDKKCVAVHSFGSLRHFRKSEQPEGAADRCCDCPKDIESCCPYSAYKIYFRDRLTKGNSDWPVNILTPEPDRKSLQDALANGPYGRCVYACDNDVVDNQVVNLQFEDGSTCSMTMTAFANHGGRRTRIFGTHGMIENEGTTIIVNDFLHDTIKKIDTNIADDGGILSGHGGGDFGLMDCFVKAVAEQDSSHILSGTDETLESHLMVFAAEKSRRTNTVSVL